MKHSEKTRQNLPFTLSKCCVVGGDLKLCPRREVLEEPEVPFPTLGVIQESALISKHFEHCRYVVDDSKSLLDFEFGLGVNRHFHRGLPVDHRMVEKRPARS